jgi:hypothetical protein
MLSPLLPLACIASAQAAEPRLEIEPIPAPALDGVPVIPWVTSGDDSWHSGAPLFDLAEADCPATARGWMAVTNQAILWHVVVQDEHHVPPQQGANLWNGDALQFAINSLGDGSDEPPQGKGGGVHMGLDDADYCVALTASGPSAHSFYHGRAGQAGDKKDVVAHIARDEAAHTTTYDIAVPWSDMGTAPGLSATIKVALQVNDSEPNAKQKRLHWGTGVGGQFVPAGFHRIALGAPPAAIAKACVSKPYLTANDGCAEIIVAVSADHDQALDAAFGPLTKSLAVPAAAGAPVERFAVRAYAGGPSTGSLPLSARIVSGGATRASAEQRIFSDSSESWFTFTPVNDYGDSVIGLNDWTDKPAGSHGFLRMSGKDFTFEDGTRVKFWGVGRHSCKPPQKHEDAVALASWYEKMGITGVRDAILFSPEWNGIGDRNDTTKTNPKEQDEWDFMHAEFRKRGTYHGFSSFWSEGLRPGDASKVENFAEAKAHAMILANFAEDIQDLHIAAAVNLLQHKNPYTGLTYAEDASLAFISVQNEHDIFFYDVPGAVNACPTYRAKARRKFCDWLRQQYTDEAGLAKAWGEHCIGVMDGCDKDESLDRGTLNPFFGAWWFSPSGLENQQQRFGAKRRLLDSARFLYEMQTAYYLRFAKAVHDTGWKGVVIGSDWQADSGVPHLSNLLSDRAVGYIDRHNYFGGSGRNEVVACDSQDDSSLLWHPGRALLSTGLQQFADRPFGMSEWACMPPNEWIAEGPVVMGLYGMGLQGWDALYVSFGNYAGFSPTVADKGTQVYNGEAPVEAGLYPAIARAIYRGDVREGDVVAARRFTEGQLRDGTLDFVEAVEQAGDVKQISGTTPIEALAAGKVVLEVMEKPTPSTFPDLSAQLKEHTITANTGQLVWRYASQDEAYITINTDGTKGLCGFTPKESFKIGDTSIAVDNRFAVVLVTALGKKDSLATAKHVLITAVARQRNTGMVYSANRGVSVLGTGPVLLEPVEGTVTLARKPKAVHLLDQDGRMTERTAKLDGTTVTIDGASDKTMWYEVDFE